MHLVIFGLGYAGKAVAEAAVTQGIHVTATSRAPERLAAPTGVQMLHFGSPLPDGTTHVLSTAPPDAEGDPVLRTYKPVLAKCIGLRWAGYVSTTGVYGNRDGAWVDEASAVSPGQERSRRRVAAEQEWASVAGGIAVDLFRVAGIYGPGRSALDEVRAGRTRRVSKPGHVFSRIHVEDIAGAVLAAMTQEAPAGVRVLHLADDMPAESAEVTTEAARLLGITLPPPVPFDTAVTDMSEMARSFWAENRRVASTRTQEALGYRWRYPNYMDGLRAILARGG